MGRSVVPLVRRAGEVRSGPPGISLLCGIWLAGTGLLGLSLVGLIYGWVAIGILFAGYGLPRVRHAILLPIREVLVKSRRMNISSIWWAIPAILLSIMYMSAAIIPDTHVDSYSYHLAVPAQILKAHKFTGEGASFQHHFPLTAEMVFLPAVALGLDALPHLINLCLLMVCVGAIASWAEQQTNWIAHALTWSLIPSFVLAAQSVIVAKSDMLACAYAVVGGIALFGKAKGRVRSPSIVSAILLGAGAATKFNGVVLLALSCVIMIATRPTFLRGAFWMSIAILMWISWPLKSWLMTGDPMHPMLSSHLGSELWNQQSAASVLIARGEPLSPLKWMSELVGNLLTNQPIVLVLLILALFTIRDSGAAERRVGLWATLGLGVLSLAIPGQWFRLSLPCLLLVIGCGVVSLTRGIAHYSSGTRATLLFVSMLSTWIPAGMFTRNLLDPVSAIRYLIGQDAPSVYLESRCTTSSRLAHDLGGLPDVKRVIGFGDIRFYHVPGRFLMERCYGETWAWKLSRESRNASDILKRFREMGCGHLVYNFVTETYPHEYARPFIWNQRMIEVWRTFFRSYVEMIVPPSMIDHVNGGFCIFRVRRTQVGSSPRFQSYLPGYESLYLPATRAALSGDWILFQREVSDLEARLPNVGGVTAMAAQAYRQDGKWSAGLSKYRTLVAHGAIYDETWLGAAVCASEMGYDQEALHYAEHALELNLDWKSQAERIIGRSCNNLAFHSLEKRSHIGTAIKWSQRAVALDPGSAAFRHTLALLQLATGDRRGGAMSLHIALNLAQDAASRRVIEGDIQREQLDRTP